MLEHGVRQIAFSSTCATYGLPEKIPISENHPQNPISPYGASKLMVERILRDCGTDLWPAIDLATLFHCRGSRSRQ